MSNRRKLRKLLWQAFRIVGADKVFLTYFVFFVAMAFFLYITEPSITKVGDSFWYCFAVATTVGFGDIAAISFLGRILTVILSIYSIAVIAIFTAVITSFFLDIAKARARESTKEFLYDLEHLPDLSKEELQNLSDRIKKFNEKM